MIAFTIPGPAVPCPRPRVVKGHAYYGERYETWRVLAQAEALSCGRPLWDAPVWVEVTFHGARSNGDIDNLIKSCLDMGTGILWTDDRYVDRILAEKLPVLNPRDRRTVIKAGLL